MPLSTSNVLDRDENASICTLPMLLFGRRRVVSGIIRTIRCFEDNALIKSTLATDSPGEILVVDGGGSVDTALLGDQIAASALAHGWAAVILFGAVRDSTALGTLDFHVKTLDLIPRKSAKRGKGEINVSIHCGGVDFVPGHYLYSDPDGVVVLSYCIA